MAKTAVVKTRMDDETLSELERLAEQMTPPVTVSALVRQSVVEFVRRHAVKAEWAEAVTLDELEPLGVIPS